MKNANSEDSPRSTPLEDRSIITQNSGPHSMLRLRLSAWQIFVAALAIRWIYALILYALMGDEGLMGVDSHTYVIVAERFADAIASGHVHGSDWFGPDPVMMPLFTCLITLVALLFGHATPLAFTLLQGIFDAGTCVLVYAAARTLKESYAIPAGIAAALNPTQVVLSGLVYTDTPFTFFIALYLYGSIKWIYQPSWRAANLIAVGVGAAMLIRIVAAPWALVLPALLLITSVVMGTSSRQRAFQVAIVASVAVGCTLFVTLRNVAQYNVWSLTPQGGHHLAIWVVPLSKEAQDGTPWAQSMEEMEARKLQRFGPPSDDPFEEDRRYKQLGKEAIAQIPIWAIAKAWAFGAAINLGSPAVTLSPLISQLPRTGFYASTGKTLTEKVVSFLFRSGNAPYTIALLLGFGGLAALRLLQVFGIVDMAGQRPDWPVLVLYGLWVAYIVATNGPVGSPKYRLPIEPVLMVLTGAGVRRVLAVGKFAGPEVVTA